MPSGWPPRAAACRRLLWLCVYFAGAPIDPKDDRGFTPLHHAAMRNAHGTLVYLLRAGADATATGKDAGQTVDVLGCLPGRGSETMFMVINLLAYGAKLSEVNVGCQESLRLWGCEFVFPCAFVQFALTQSCCPTRALQATTLEEKLANEFEAEELKSMFKVCLTCPCGCLTAPCFTVCVFRGAVRNGSST